MILRVFVSDIIDVKSKHELIPDYFWVIGQLKSGLEICINSYFYDLKEYIGQHVEMLLCVLRSPYMERGWKEQLFLANDFYSVKLIDELIESKGFRRGDSKRQLKLTGEFVDSYIIPKDWVPLITSIFFKSLLNEPSALKTEDGIYLLNPTHLHKRIPIEEFPQEVTIATGCIDLAAWRPI